MLLKNPWCDGLVWKGVGSSATVDAATYPPPSPTLSRPARQPDYSISNKYETMTGTFWISFEDVVQNFESLYLNWNPSLFTDRQDHHFVWPIPSRAMARSFAHNPQYTFTSPTTGAVWILLSRHFQDGELPIARSRASRNPPASSLAEVSNSLGFMSIYLFASSGQRVQLPDRSLHSAPFVDSPQTLVRFDARAGVPYTVVVAQASMPLLKYTFTLSFFSRAPLAVTQATPALAHYTELDGSWTRRTAGGNARTATFFHNPQFALVVPRPTPLSLLLSTDTDDLPVHVDLVWANGERVTALTVRNIVCTSGEYRRGCTLAEVRAPAEVDAGTYTVVVSTFEPGHLASFVLRVGSSHPVSLRPVLSDAAGRLRSELSPVVFGEGESERKRARITITRLTRASVVARSGSLDGYSASSGTVSPAVAPCSVRVSFEYGSGPHASVIAMTGDGEFADATMGLRTGEVDLDPDMLRRAGGLWLVVEQIGSHREGQGIQVDVLSDGQVYVGAWEMVDV